MSSLLRLTGRASLVAGGVHLLQFLVLGIGPALGEPEYPSPAESAAGVWFGVAGLATFAAIALTYLVVFSAGTELAWHGATGTSVVWRRAAQSAAVVATTAWLASGALNLARRGFNARGIDTAAGGDEVIGAAVLQGSYVILSALAITASVGLATWFVAFAVRGRRTEVIGMPTAVAVGVLAVIPLAGWVLDIGGVPTTIIAFVVLGIVLLRRARRAAAVAQ